MLTISKLMDAVTNRDKMWISQNKLAEAYNTSASTINAWIRRDIQPNMETVEIYKGINECRKQWTPYQNEVEFIEKIISYLDIPPYEKDALNVQFNSYKNKYPSASTCGKEFFLHLIDLALKKSEIRKPIQYDFLNPAQPVIGIGERHVIAATHDGRALSTGANDFQQCNTHEWRNIVSVSAGWKSSIGLKMDGSCIAIGNNAVGNGEIFSWNNMVCVCCGAYHFLGLRADGAVVAYGLGGNGQCDVAGWKHVVALAAGTEHSVGLLDDGTVIACGSNRQGQCEVSSWKHVKQIAASGDHTIALTEGGEILLAGNKYIYDFSGWKDVVAIATGFYHIVGLKSDGSVLHTGHTIGGLDKVYTWWDIKAIFAGYNTTVGIKSDGSVNITNDKYSRTYLNSSSWRLLGEIKSHSSGEPPFEIARKKIVSSLEQIRELGIALSPSLHGRALDDRGSQLLKEIIDISRTLWEFRDKIVQIKPLADLILMYCSAFKDFVEEFTIDDQNKAYLVSDRADDVAIEWLTATALILSDLRNLD